jgi:hypothetical protein
MNVARIRLKDRYKASASTTAKRSGTMCVSTVSWHPATECGRMLQRDVIPGVLFDAGYGRRSAIDGRTTNSDAYRVSQQRRKRIEEFFGWLKTVAGQRKTKYRGLWRVGWFYTFAAAAYNLVRMRTLQAVMA